MFYSRYTLLLVLFVLISAVAGFMLHYHFITESRTNYPNTISLAKFFGFFTGTMFLFVYGVDRFLIRKILYSYDSPYSLVLIPALLSIAAVASLIVDLLVGQSAVISGFSFGFLMVAMLKVAYETTYEAIELPSSEFCSARRPAVQQCTDILASKALSEWWHCCIRKATVH
jgi:hypothetical protein